jgi:hypothetical protein
MNEKIKELAEAAGITFTDYGSGEFLDKDDIDTDRLEKFAELIVKECEAYIKEHTWAESGELLKHFGVEE